MGLSFEAAIEGGEVRCRIGSDALIPSPVWCFSMLGPVRVAAGGTLIRSLAGYAEVQLPDLAPGRPREVVVGHAQGVGSLNRAGLPQGSYLRLEDDVTMPLPPLPGGVPEVPARPVPPLEGLPLVPPPREWAPAGGVLAARAFDPGPGDAAFAAVARLSARLGLGPFVAADGAALRLREEAGLPPGGYRIEVAPRGATVWAPDAEGRRHAAVTLLNLVAATGGRLPAGRIEDAPRLPWRGLHLDCARHAFAPRTILRVLDLMALLKMNRLHWQLSDDEGVRLDLAVAPDLARRAGRRGEGLLLPGLLGAGTGAGGTYGAEDVGRVVAQAAELGIGVMPGIELPAHAGALCAAMPGLRDPEDRGTEASAQGYPRNVVNPAMSATWDLLQPLLDEVAGMFPLGIVHLGGRDLPDGAWEGSPAVEGLKDAQGLSGRDDVLGWTMARLARSLGERGVRAALWDEAGRAPGGPGDTLLLATGAPGAAPPGRDVVLCPARHVRLDAAHTDDPGDWGAAGAVSLDDTAAWRVQAAEEAGARVVGVQGLLWSEVVTDDRQVEALLLPRLLGVAAKAWAAPGRIDGDRLRALAGAYGPVLDRIGWRWNRGA